MAVADVRPPQQARSHATREKIVLATTGCLADLGFSGASTPAVAARAGVSQGALFKHFPSKPQLLAACAEHILAGFVADFRADMTARMTQAVAGAGLAERIAPAVTALWTIFRRPEMPAVFEVYLAARTDATLAHALGPILDRHRESILGEARRVFPELPVTADFDAAVNAVVYAMQGVVLGLFAPDATTEKAHLAFFERLARRELEHALSKLKGQP